MTVRAKPWTLDNNSNTDSCDGSNNTINGWSGGDTDDFLQQLIDECGDLCLACTDCDEDGTEDNQDNCLGVYNPSQDDTDGDGIGDECDDCNNMSGDTNDDMTIDILDIVTVVNIILNGGISSPNYTECELSDANYNGDSTINVLDIIQIINQILGLAFMNSDFQIQNNNKINTIVEQSNEIDLSKIQIVNINGEDKRMKVELLK